MDPVIPTASGTQHSPAAASPVAAPWTRSPPATLGLRPVLQTAFRTAAAVMAASLLIACGGRDSCTSSASCPPTTTCQANGVCRPLASAAGLRFTHAEWLNAADYGLAASDQPATVLPAGDDLAIDGRGDRIAYLAFGPVPRDREVVEAVLRLAPPASGTLGRARLVLERTAPFFGVRLTWRHRPAARQTIATRTVDGPSARSIRFDITALLQTAQRERRDWLFVGLRRSDDDSLPFAVASPVAADRARRPRIELLLR